MDWMTNLDFAPSRDLGGLRVHRGFWRALTKGKVPESVAEELDKLRDRGIRRYVYCGHSQGGAYATLTAAKHVGAGRTVAGVVTLGAPQVIRAAHTNPVWKRLDELTTNFVNSYDIVPRWPSNVEWIKKMAPYCDLQLASSRSRSHSLTEAVLSSIDKSCGKLFRDYRPVGKLLMTTSRHDKVKEITYEELGEAPWDRGNFIVRQHHQTEYRKNITGLSTRAALEVRQPTRLHRRCPRSSAFCGLFVLGAARARGGCKASDREHMVHSSSLGLAVAGRQHFLPLPLLQAGPLGALQFDAARPLPVCW